ncbi:hypothetical protein BJF79_13545 [Actinomadura sp. CNU-125]|uniref:hypothetical protein n=1 Tax=Actinomadura sp. CNU-125 TaxID=1904961 RepID=UPI0009599F86|nr:hypothetical protein [Actinomadura sp. CNU-125]OLT24362.1 hypothetical protein BJF79_13545 [Actinomadura sp. CNU-125]
MIRYLPALLARWVDRFRWSNITAVSPTVGRAGDDHWLIFGVDRRWRKGYLVKLTTEDVEALAENLARNVEAAKRWRVEQGPRPVHVGGNAEDCPACDLIPSAEIPYPWHCPGPQQTPPGDHQDAGGVL